METYKFKAYGQVIQSDIKPPYHEDMCIGGDVNLWIRTNSTNMYNAEKLKPINEGKCGLLRLSMDQTGVYYITHSKDPDRWITISANEIVVNSKKRALTNSNNYWKMIDPTSLAFVLRQMNLLVIHGSAIVDNKSGKVTALIAPSGTGKTTLSLSLCRSGRYSLLADDMIVMEKIGGDYYVYHDLGYVKLWPNSLDIVYPMVKRQFNEKTDRLAKCIIPFAKITSGYHVEKAPINRMIYVHTKADDSVGLIKVDNNIWIKYVLSEMLYNSMVSPRMLFQQYQLLYDILQQGITSYILRYQQNTNSLKEIVEFL